MSLLCCDAQQEAMSSTFMVECRKCAYILNGSTPHSLVLIDEFGRGTRYEPSCS